MIFLLLVFVVFLVPTSTTQAQDSNTTTTVIAKRKNRRIKRRKTKRKVRRTVRRVNRRNTRFKNLSTLPIGTRAVLYRNVNYYPVRGAYYIKRNGVYLRRVPPIGFRIAKISGSLFRFSFLNRPYIFSSGLFYQQVDDYYELVDAPVGAVVPELPEETEEVLLQDVTAYELYDILYEKTNKGYGVLGSLEDFE